MLEQQNLFDFVINFQLNVFPKLLLWTVIDEFEIAKRNKIRWKLKKVSKVLLFPKHFSRWTLVTCRLTSFFAKSSWKFLPENWKPLWECTNWKTSRKRAFSLVDDGLELISQNRFPSLFQTTYKDKKFWETFSWSLHANTRAKRLFNASWKNGHSMNFPQPFFSKSLLICGVLITHVNTSQNFLSWNHKTSINKYFRKEVIPKYAFELVQKLVWEHHQKEFRSESRKTLGNFLPKNFTEHLDINFEKFCRRTSAST